jgi:hypothetical protein
VLILTANPMEAGEPFDGLLGVASKPWNEDEIRRAVSVVRSG